MSDTEGSDDRQMSVGDTDGWGSRYGWFYSKDSDLVYNPQQNSYGPLIINEDGDVENRFVRRGLQKVGEGEGLLWGRLAPVEIGEIEIRQNTKIWHDKREDWLLADRIGLIEEPEVEPKITFIVRGEWPKTRITYPASQLVELREDGVIESQKEVNERAANALEQHRQNSGGDPT